MKEDWDKSKKTVQQGSAGKRGIGRGGVRKNERVEGREERIGRRKKLTGKKLATVKKPSCDRLLGGGRYKGKPSCNQRTLKSYYTGKEKANSYTTDGLYSRGGVEGLGGGLGGRGGRVLKWGLG